MSHQKTRGQNPCFRVDYLPMDGRGLLLQKFLFKNSLIRF